jgi:hypothetical protein
MRGFLRAAARLALMALVMAAVIVATTAVGLPTTAVLGLSVTVAGLVGMLLVGRRSVPKGSNGDAALAAMRVGVPAPAAPDPKPDPNAASDPLVESMAPDQVVDPEALMPRWRRPSLLAARRADPTRLARVERPALRFPVTGETSSSRRIVRYAVVALLDRPDEVLGRQLADLMSGDEVEVIESGGPFWQVACPDGQTGWVHRTTLGAAGADNLSFGRRMDPATESDDLLTAVLSARGIQ